MARSHSPRLTVLQPRQAIERIEAACNATVAAATRGHIPPVTCQAGCSYCCHQPVFITPLEGLAIERFVNENGWAVAVVARTAAYLRELAARPGGSAALAALRRNVQGRGPLPTPEQRKAIFGPACPFLEDGLCSIYPVRPLMCREHISFDVVEKCERDEPFFGLEKPRFDEVSGYLTREVSLKLRVLPVWEFERAANAAPERPIPAREVDDLLRWKTGNT